MNSKNKNISLKLEQSIKFLEKCFKDIDDFDTDFSKALDQMEAEAIERVIDSYYRNLELF